MVVNGYGVVIASCVDDDVNGANRMLHEILWRWHWSVVWHCNGGGMLFATNFFFLHLPAIFFERALVGRYVHHHHGILSPSFVGLFSRFFFHCALFYPVMIVVIGDFCWRGYRTKDLQFRWQEKELGTCTIIMASAPMAISPPFLVLF